MLGFGTKEKKPKNQAEAFERFKVSIQTAIAEAQANGVWPITLGDYLEAHALSLGAAQVRR